jgi:membrane protein implicated in regulation of membrane protease activity
MSWETFYATCFVVGLLLSALSFLAGAVHLHVPRGLHLGAGHVHVGGPHAHGPHHGSGGGRGASYFNFGTITAFLAWFGGTGYLLTRYSGLWALLALGISTLSGIGGAAVVFWFLFKVLLAHDKDLDPSDYDMIGVLAHISSPIRQGGTGEIIFSQEGVRRSASARSDTGKAIARGAEVVVTQYKGGIAYVRQWEEMTGADSAASAAQH